jgi:uncharacterized protein DUF5916
MLRAAACLLIAMGLLGSPLVALAEGPRLEARKAVVAPKVDGALSDAVWQQPLLATGFTRETHPPTEDTRVWATYDGNALYFAFDCVDTRPSEIRAQQKKRNGSLTNDDWVAVGIEPLGDRRTVYWFQVNPVGTQAEEIPGGAATKVEWRGDWTAAATINSHGWTAELAIPFSLLKYPPGQRQFGLTFRRNLARIGEETSWPSGTSYFTQENQAIWTGVEAPRQRVLPRYMPYTLIGAGGNIKNGYGTDIKYTAPNNVTGLLAIKPDFQTIEDVIQTIDFTYTERFLPDRRPFFTEGGGYFDDPLMFYSRAIGEIDAGMKGFGKIGHLGFGALDALKAGDVNDLLVNLNYDVTRYSNIRVAMVQHNGEQENRVLRLSADWRRPAKINGYYWGASAYQSSGSGAAAIATHAYIDRWGGSGLPGWHIYYDRIPKDYSPALAFVPEKDKESIGGWVDDYREYKTGPLLSWYAKLGYNYASHLTGGLFYKGLQPGLGATFRKNWSLLLNSDLSDRPPYRDRVVSLSLGLNIRDLYRSAYLQVRAGYLNGGDYLFASLNKGFKLSNKLSFRLSMERLSLAYPDNRQDIQVMQGVILGVYDFTPERGVVFRLVGNNQSVNGYAAYRQELRRGNDVFLILGNPNATSFRPRIGCKVVHTY